MTANKKKNVIVRMTPKQHIRLKVEAAKSELAIGEFINLLMDEREKHYERYSVNCSQK